MRDEGLPARIAGQWKRFSGALVVAIAGVVSRIPALAAPLDLRGYHQQVFDNHYLPQRCFPR